MLSRSALTCAAFGVISLVGTVSTLAQQRADARKLFKTDLRTICECMHRVEHDLGLRELETVDRAKAANVAAKVKVQDVIVIGGDAPRQAVIAPGRDVPRQAVVIIDRERLPHVESHHIHVAQGIRSTRKEHPHLGRTVKLDPDTGECKIDPDSGELSEPAGYELVDSEAHGIQIQKRFIYSHDKKHVMVEIARQYPYDGVMVRFTSWDKDGPAICRELMTALESKQKLAAKIKEEKDKKGPDKPK